MTKRRLVIESGQVVCPETGVIDVEHCFSCDRFLTVRGDGGHDGAARIVCRAPWSGVADAWDLYACGLQHWASPAAAELIRGRRARG